jgi:hypothetical protein
MRFKVCRTVRIKVEPIKFEQVSKPGSPLHKYIAFISGSLLAISETLPFFSSFKANGILQAVSGIIKEYKEDLK